VLLALLAGALLAPSAARASCGDYVLIGDRPAGAAHHAPTNPGDHPAPCSGPFCSRHPVQPPLLPVAPVSERVDQWGCVGALGGVPDEPFLGRVSGDPGERPVRQGRAIYHPPR
jgi:hypothetical protein